MGNFTDTELTENPYKSDDTVIPSVIQDRSSRSDFDSEKQNDSTNTTNNKSNDESTNKAEGSALPPAISKIDLSIY